MRKEALEKAKRRLERAETALEWVKVSENWKQFEPAWSDLLLAGNSVHSVLEQGAKLDPKSRQWFGGKKRERREIQLLSYMHQARNSDEHGIEPVAKEVPGSIGVRGNDSGTFIERMTVINGQLVEFSGVNGDGTPLEADIVLPHVRLVRVTDERYGTSFDPPDVSPIRAGSDWVDYLRGLVAEAETLVSPD